MHDLLRSLFHSPTPSSNLSTSVARSSRNVPDGSVCRADRVSRSRRSGAVGRTPVTHPASQSAFGVLGTHVRSVPADECLMAEPRVHDGNPARRWIKHHPVLGGIYAFGFSVGAGLLIFGFSPVVVFVSVPFGLLNWYGWRPGGPFVRLTDRMYRDD
jgi:hypothetical protein